jgi:hypothetical protein
MFRFIILCLLVGCVPEALDTSTTTDPLTGTGLEGKWYRKDATYDCFHVLEIGSEAYSLYSSCKIGYHKVAEVEMGEYTEEGGKLVFYRDRGTCAESVDLTSYEYELVDTDHLRVISGVVSVLYERGKDPQPEVAINYGCYDDMGSFIAKYIIPY